MSILMAGILGGFSLGQVSTSSASARLAAGKAPTDAPVPPARVLSPDLQAVSPCTLSAPQAMPHLRFFSAGVVAAEHVSLRTLLAFCHATCRNS